jgi:hypothetical protein
MANADTPFGLKPVRHKGGAPYNGAANPYLIPSSDSADMFIGDPVVKTGTANTAEIKRVGGDFGIGTLPAVAKATAGSTNRITGVIVGFMPVTRESEVYGVASTDRVAMVADDPDLVFEAQGDDALAVTGVGANANLVFTHSGSTITGKSGVEIDSSTSAVGATLQCRVLRFANRTDNEAAAAANKVEVMINLHTETTGVGSAGL